MRIRMSLAGCIGSATALGEARRVESRVEGGEWRAESGEGRMESRVECAGMRLQSYRTSSRKC
jgi:hypothetical protein